MSTKLYVGNLAYETSEDTLRELFSQAGTVTDVVVIKDRDTGQSKGFGFVTFETQSEAENAIQMYNGKSVGNRELRVNVARPPEDRPRGGGGYNSGGNRRGGNSGGRRY